ncbi:MAG: ATP-binding cassette domain-containing protein, partial [Tissierellia bacterium]|nr:ATP-binding cassette domain-containing protein [Tissierellia bacterium]
VLKGKAKNSYHVSRLIQDIDLDIYPSTEIIRYDIQVRQILFCVSHLTCLAVLWISAIEVVNGELEGIFLAMIGLIALASFETIEQFPQSLSELRTSVNAAMDLLPLLNNKQHQKKYLKVGKLSGNLILDKITFNFHQPGEPFIENLNLSIPEGSRVAFVGTSGSGKSTVAKLLIKLWSPDDGHIYWGRHVYDELAEEQIREHIGLLEQMPSFFNTSLKENLLLANPQASDCELWKKLELVNLKELVSSWPKGLDSSIGENGMKLSAGERQRLALARLLLKNVRVLILDEPTQGLDKKRAEYVMELVEKIMRKRGLDLILITHDLSLAKRYSKNCLLLKNGRWIDCGPTDKVLSHKSTGYSKALWRALPQNGMEVTADE